MNRDQIAEVIAKLRRHYVGAANELEDDLGEAIGLLLAIQSDGWQKIDSAPRDGTVFLATNTEHGFAALGFFNPQREFECIDFRRQVMGVGFYPTHWQAVSFPQPPGDAG